MTSSINASTSGGGGVITSADSSGILALQTGGTTAVTIDGSQNVGIGTSSPTSVANYKTLNINGTTGGIVYLQSNGTNVLQLSGDASSIGVVGLTNIPMLFSTNNTERMRIDSSGIITGTAGNLMLVSGTSVTASGSSTIDFTGIPSWAKKITVGFQNISTAATSSISIRLGTSGGVPTTGYQCGFATMAGTDGSTDIAFRVTSSSTAAQIANGSATLVNVSGNHWSGNSLVTRYSSSGFVSAAGITLGDTLTTVRVFLEAATTFDAGSINIFYE